ncbi:unnamed protein product [Dicrocoelium dendriticum]|nr:unnamed protein product [Dicrocoelium dendriticum]
MRLRSDQLQNAPVQPTPNLNSDVKSGRSISTTYLTRKGYLFLYPSSLEVEAWEQQVTPAELHNLVKTKINQSLHHEGKNHRTAFLNNHLKIIGVLKRNLEFPETWCSPGRETVPPLATMKGLSCAEFLRDQGSRKTYASSSHYVKPEGGQRPS